MRETSVSELKPGQEVDQVFLIRAKQIRQARNGTKYFQAELCDSTGAIAARMWDASEVLLEALGTTNFVRVRGHVEVYREQPQLILASIRPAPAEEVDLERFLPHSPYDPAERLAKLRGVVGTVKNEHLRALLGAFLDDPEFVARFQRCPAAVSYHHATIGGLIEHTTSIVELAERILSHYPQLNRDMLIAGCILHDIGKTRELAYTETFAYTVHGELVGHVVSGVLMIEEKARGLGDFPPELLDELRHVVLSHHGEYEFGAPKLPMTREALALHYLDNLDAKLEAVTRALEEETTGDATWTEHLQMLRRRFYRGSTGSPRPDSPRPEPVEGRGHLFSGEPEGPEAAG
jgi:3'-5' exoribonuclease